MLVNPRLVSTELWLRRFPIVHPEVVGGPRFLNLGPRVCDPQRIRLFKSVR